MKRANPLPLRLVFLLPVLYLSACGVRPYDYVAPPWNTLAASLWGTPTPTAVIQMVPTFTALPSASLTPSVTVSPTQTPLPPTQTATALDTPFPGTASILLENRTVFTVYVRLKGKVEQAFELAVAEALPVELPAGVYDYWIVLPAQESLHGQKVLSPGFSNWIFYDTPRVVDSPTPWWPGWRN